MNNSRYVRTFNYVLAVVDDVDVDGNRAHVLDSYGRRHVVSLLPRRGGGATPRVGESWILDRSLGELAFHSLLIPNPPVVGNLGELSQSLDDMGFIVNELEVGEGGLSTYTPELTATPEDPDVGDGEIRGVYFLDGSVVHVWVVIEFGFGPDDGEGDWGISLPLPLNQDYHKDFFNPFRGDLLGQAIISTTTNSQGAIGVVAWTADKVRMDSTSGFIDDGFGIASNGQSLHLNFSYVTTDEHAVAGVVEGSKWHVDSGSPSSLLGSLGDFYLDSFNGDVYNKQSFDDWVLVSNIRGPQGALETTGFVFGETLYFDAAGSPYTFSKGDFPGMRAVRAKVQSAGGGGGGAQATGAGQWSNGAGGGAGGYAESFILVDELSDDETVTVGSGGTGGSGNNDGNTGFASSFGAHAQAAGGSGGGVRPAEDVFRASIPGPGGTVSTGDLQIRGGGGHSGFNFSNSFAGGVGGAGGDAVLGKGHRSARSNTTAQDGSDYGSGGSGAANGPSQSASDGGDGGDGIVIVEIYY